MINFNKFYKLFNLISLSLVVASVLLLFFKGLNFGVDFKGGTLIELRANDKAINVTSLRQSFNKMNLGDFNVKKFGNENDFLIKIEKKDTSANAIEIIKKELTSSIGGSFNFRRVENVGPKVSSELLKSGIITSATTLLALVSIYLFGGEILKGFSLAMIMGVVFGTYSSIYIANPILVKLRVSQKTILKEDTE